MALETFRCTRRILCSQRPIPPGGGEGTSPVGYSATRRLGEFRVNRLTHIDRLRDANGTDEVGVQFRDRATW